MVIARRPQHISSLRSNLQEVTRLLKIHEGATGTKPGRRVGVEVLNKSGVVLLVACWEAYVEDLATAAFDALLSSASSHTAFPNRVLALASQPLRAAPDESKVWDLAGVGWRQVLSDHRDRVLGRYVGKLNTPKSAQVSELFEKLVGFPNLSSHWRWSSLTSATARDRLDALVTLRGQIAHRVTTSRSVHKGEVVKKAAFLGRLAAISSNRLRTFVHARTGEYPWSKTRYRSTQ